MTLFVIITKNPVNGQEYIDAESADGFIELADARHVRDMRSGGDDGWTYWVGKVVPVEEET